MPLFSTVRVRSGIAFDRALVYVTGGVAIGTLKNYYTDDIGESTLTDWTHNRTQAGFVVGGGIEYAFTSNWSAKTELLYAGFDQSEVTGVCHNATSTCFRTLEPSRFGFASQHVIGRVGLNYRFGGGGY
jgi:outer membrane immunogenic protein